jgi:hypothetical protein
MLRLHPWYVAAAAARSTMTHGMASKSTHGAIHSRPQACLTAAVGLCSLHPPTQRLQAAWNALAAGPASRHMRTASHAAAGMPCAAHGMLLNEAWVRLSPQRWLARVSVHERRAPRLTPHAAAASAQFYAPDADSFAALQLEPEVVEALRRCGFERPSHIQVRMLVDQQCVP